MCFSALLNAKVTKLSKRFDAQIDLPLFESLFARRLQDPSIKLLHALELEFLSSTDSAEGRIRDLIHQQQSQQREKWQAELTKQQQRLQDANASLQRKPTAKAQNDQRIATSKIESLESNLRRLDDMKERPRDSRVFPMVWAPIVIQRNGENFIRPMRYHCRPAGKPAAYDQRYPGLYNARRDNLTRFWQGQFGVTHAVVVVQKFYENVSAHHYNHHSLEEGETDQNLVVEYEPEEGQEMVVACLWSHWQDASEALDSFAAVTDEPPADVAATGHDRCIVPLKAENVSKWLDPEKYSAAELDALLADRQSFHFQHRPAS